MNLIICFSHIKITQTLKLEYKSDISISNESSRLKYKIILIKHLEYLYN